MNIFFFIILTLFLFILQTVILPTFSWFPQCFDLLIIVILYISLITNRHSVLFAVVFIGAVMDSTSGVPFFLHIFSYLWIYIIVQLVKQLLFQHSLVFILVISVVSVLIQQGLVLLSIFVRQGPDAFIGFNYGLLIRQAFWGLLFIGPSIWLINTARVNWIFTARAVKKQLVRKYRGEL